MLPGDIEELADSTRDLLRELALVRAEGEALRRELEMAWAGEDDDRPTLVPETFDGEELIEVIEFERRDTLRC